MILTSFYDLRLSTEKNVKNFHFKSPALQLVSTQAIPKALM